MHSKICEICNKRVNTLSKDRHKREHEKEKKVSEKPKILRKKKKVVIKE